MKKHVQQKLSSKAKATEKPWLKMVATTLTSLALAALLILSAAKVPWHVASVQAAHIARTEFQPSLIAS